MRDSAVGRGDAGGRGKGGGRGDTEGRGKARGKASARDRGDVGGRGKHVPGGTSRGGEEESKICCSCSDLSTFIPLLHKHGVSEQMWGALPSRVK